MNRTLNTTTAFGLRKRLLGTMSSAVAQQVVNLKTKFDDLTKRYWYSNGNRVVSWQKLPWDVAIKVRMVAFTLGAIFLIMIVILTMGQHESTPLKFSLTVVPHMLSSAAQNRKVLQWQSKVSNPTAQLAQKHALLRKVPNSLKKTVQGIFKAATTNNAKARNYVVESFGIPEEKIEELGVKLLKDPSLWEVQRKPILKTMLVALAAGGSSTVPKLAINALNAKKYPYTINGAMALRNARMADPHALLPQSRSWGTMERAIRQHTLALNASGKMPNLTMGEARNHTRLMVRSTSALEQEYISIKLGVNFCKSATFMRPHTHKFDEYGGIGFLIDGAKAIELGTLKSVGKINPNFSLPTKNVCSMPSEFHSNKPSKADLARAYNKTIAYANSPTMRNKATRTEAKIDLTDDAILGLVIPYDMPWNILTTTVKIGHNISKKYGGPNKLATVYAVDPVKKALVPIHSPSDLIVLQESLKDYRPKINDDIMKILEGH